MGPLPQGPANKHVNSSRGADCSEASFYVTEYSRNHGKDGYIPTLGKHVGTGYKSNFRPGLYYSRKLDELDNPSVGKLLVENYSSSNKIQFQSHRGSDGTDHVPKDVHMVKSGFVRDVPKTLPPYHQVRTVCYDSKYPLNAKQTQSYLFGLQHKDPIGRENDCRGPGYMTTENHTRFVKQQNMDTSGKTFGPKEGSGFTHAYNNEPITYRPNECFDGKSPGWLTYRPTARSVMKMSFQQILNPDANEPFTQLSKTRLTPGCREMQVIPAHSVRLAEAYTKTNEVHCLTQKRIRQNDPAEYFNMAHAKYFPSMTRCTFEGVQPEEETFANMEKNIGKKENTGYTRNNSKFVETKETPESLKRFDSHYKARFYDKNPKSSIDLTKTAVMKQLSNGFTKSSAVNSYGTEMSSRQELRKLNPYVKKSIFSRYPYYLKEVTEKPL